tara:strand:+ start:5293 stop:11601 length:6309 start_codon:yes stop_codon:yes gene_type:complete
MPDTPLVTEPVEINPLTGLPIGGTPTIDTTGPQEAPINPLTGIPMQNVKPSVTLGGGAGTPDLMQSQLYGSQYNTYRKDDINRYLKYDVPLGQDLDWDELRARHQSTSEKWGNGLAKMGVTALGALAENTLGIVAGLGEMFTGGSYYDNAVGKTIDKTNEWMREHMPNYYTKRAQEMSILEGMGTANFWADKVAGGIGYSIGAIASLYVTGGGSLFVKGATMAGRGMGIYNTSKAIINGTKLAKNITQGAALSTRLRTAAQTLEAGAMMSLAEGSVEARETQRQTYDTLVQQYLKERPGMTEGDIPSQILQDFEDVSYSAGNTNFAMQMPVLMGTNLLMFGKQVTGFKGMSKANTDVLFDAAANQAVNTLAKQGFVAQSLSRLRPIFVNGMGETVQESLQFGSGAFSSTYHTDKYNNGGHGDMSKALAAAGDAMLSKEGLESALIGFLTGGIMGGGQSIIGGEYTNRKNNAQALTDLINSGIFDKTNQRYQTAEASSAVIKRMHDALQKGDHKSFKDEQFKLIQYQALEALERGGFDVMVQKLEDSKELPESEFMSAYGYPQEDNSGKPVTLKDSTNKSQDQILDGVIEKLNRFKETYNNVNERFPLQDKTSGLPRLLMSEEERAAEDAVYKKQENLRSNLIFYGSEIKDRNRRMDSITNQMQDTLDTSLQGSAYAGTGPQLDVHGALQEQRPSFKGIDLLKNETGEVSPASEYNPLEQLKNTGDRLQQIADNLRLTDPIAADKFLEQAQDYMGLLQANNSAIDSYNKLSSDEYVQAEMQREIEEREAIAKQNKINKIVAEAVENAQTSEDFKDVDLENASPEIASKGKAKLMELRDAEANEYRKYMSEQPNESDSEKLERLKKIDKTKLTPVQRAGLSTAINVLEKKLNEEPAVEEEVPSREEDSVLEEAFKPDNVGKVEVISEDGREFQVDGVKLYNRELNPLDAIVRTRAGRIKKIRLTDEYGNRQVIWGPEGRVDTLAYAILMSEQFKVDSELGKVREEILEQKEVVVEEVDKELGTKGVHGAKTSDSLRQEIYSLELGLNEILEVYDNLRTSYIQEAGATKEELKNDPALKELKSKIRSLKLQIANRRRILKLRNEDVTPTDPEILKVENKANAAIEDYNTTLSESENAVKQLQDEIAQQESLLDRYKQADDLDSWRQAINNIKNKEALMLKELNKQEKLKHKINYQQTKLKRLQDAKDNDPNQNAEPTEQGITEQAEGPIDEREDKNIGESAEGQEAVVEEDVAEEKFNNEEKATQKQVIITQNSNANKTEDNQSEPGTPIQGVLFGLPEGMTEQDLMQEGSTTDLGNLISPAVQQTSEVEGIYLYHASQNKKNPLLSFNENQPMFTTKDDFGDEYKDYGPVFKYKLSENAKVVNLEDYQGKYNVDVEKHEEASNGMHPYPIDSELILNLRKEGVDVIIDDWGSYVVINKNAIENVKSTQQDSEVVSPTPVENGQEMYTKNVANGRDKKKYQQVQKIIDLGKKLDDTNAEWKILNDFGNIGSRAVVEIGTTDGDTFLMYQSSGTGTGIASKGKWTAIPGFAKDGFFLKAGFDIANNKMLTDQEFVDRGRLDADNPKFNHYGSNTFAAIAEELGRPASPIENEGIENTGTNELEVKAANIDKVRKVGEDTYDRRAPRRIVVDESGSAERHVPDMSNGQIITINQDLLLAPDIEGTEVTFEIRPNDYFTERVKEEGLENAWEYVPIYYKIGNEYVGKLAESTSLDRKALANKLENGEVVTTKISKVISGAKNVNHAIKEDGTPFFTHPEAVFGKNEVVLGVTSGFMNKFDLGDVDSSLDQGDAETITTAVSATPIGLISSGQVIAVIRGKNNPQGDPRVTPLSTANLNSTAQEAVMESFKAKNLSRAREIIANGKMLIAANTAVPGVYNKTYLDISEFPDGSGAIVYTSPSTGNLIRIKDTQLQKALSGEEYKYDFVKLAADPKLKDNIIYQAYTPKNNIYSVDIKEDLTKFVASKKYQVNKDLMNMATDYTSPIIGKYDAEGNWVGKTYKSTPDAPLGYQQYLFSNEEVAGGRILSTDLVKIGESLFNNPEVIFESIDKSIMGQVETELKIERTDTEIIDDIADEDISFDENPNNCN